MQEVERTQTARQEVGAWLKERIERSGDVDLPALTDEAVEHFWLRWNDAEIKQVFPEVLRAFVYEVGVQAIADKRPDPSRLELIWHNDSDIPWSPSANVLDGWREHVNGRYVSYTDMGAEELNEAADERERRIQTELETIERLRETAGNLETGQTVRAQFERQMSPDKEARERKNAKHDFESGMATQYWGEYKGFCWYCGTIIPEQTPPSGESWDSHSGPRCPKCGTSWARAYVGDCPVDGEGMFVHLNKPGRIKVSDDLKTAESATGPCQCDACGNVYVYDWQLLEYTERGTWAATSYEQTDKHQGGIALYGPGANGERVLALNTVMSDS